MGQLQRRHSEIFEGQFHDAPEAQVSWQSGAGNKPPQPLVQEPLKKLSTPPRWQLAALQWGLVLIIILALVLFFG